MPQGELSLRHYRELIDNPDWLNSALLSLRVGLVSSAVATILATGFGLGIWMFRPRLAALLVGFVLLPMVVPPVVSAMTLYFLLTTLSAFNDLVGYDSWLGVALAHVVMIVPFAVVLVLVAGTATSTAAWASTSAGGPARRATATPACPTYRRASTT